jgi:hypothetical protein
VAAYGGIVQVHNMTTEVSTVFEDADLVPLLR